MRGRLEKFIKEHHEELDQRVPDADVLTRIMQQMDRKNLLPEKTEAQKGILIYYRTLQWAAACILLALGLTVWKYSGNADSKDTIIAGVSGRPKPINHSTDTATVSSLNQSKAKLQTDEHRFEEIDLDLAHRKYRLAKSWSTSTPTNYKRVLLDNLNNEDSPANRIRVLSQTEELGNISNDVVDILVEVMNRDPNTNVRLAALDGLTKFYNEGYVKKQLIRSLRRQRDPMVQITLIGLLTRMKESAILTQLEVIVKDDDNIDAVKETAYSSIFELRGSQAGNHIII